MPPFLTAFGLIAIIFLVAALTSGLVERAPITFPMIFLALGFLLGDNGAGWIKITTHDATLETVATLSLAFVLFLDALNLRLKEIRKNWLLPVLSLGPGTLLTIVLGALAAAVVLHYSLINSLLIGAVLASVDPILLRDIVRDERVPRSVRDSLKTEAGANDIMVLPVLLVLDAIGLGQVQSPTGWLVLLLRLFLIGPLIGGLIGWGSVRLMEWVRVHSAISREYRAVYGMGVILAAYTGGTLLGSSGFLAVFAAGFVTAVLDYDLCDCFLDYGEISSEMAMLLTFLLFGALLSTLWGSIPLLPPFFYALAVLFVVRPIAMGAVLRQAHISRYGRLFIGWFGPRGLSSLLFGLLLISSGVPGSEQLLAVAGIVVISSVLLHGVSSAPLAAHYSRVVARQTLPEEREATAAGIFQQNERQIPRISPEELAGRLSGSNPPIVLDVRSRSTYNPSQGRIPGSIRVQPGYVTDWAAGQSKEREMITYCT